MIFSLAGDSSSRIPSSACFSGVLDVIDILCLTKNLLFAVSHPGMGVVCTIGILETAASVEVNPPGFCIDNIAGLHI